MGYACLSDCYVIKYIKQLMPLKNHSEPIIKWEMPTWSMGTSTVFSRAQSQQIINGYLLAD